MYKTQRQVAIMQFKIIVAFSCILLTSASALFIPTNLDEFEAITETTNVKALLKKYPKGKVFDDISDSNEKIFVYDVDKALLWNVKKPEFKWE